MKLNNIARALVVASSAVAALSSTALAQDFLPAFPVPSSPIEAFVSPPPVVPDQTAFLAIPTPNGGVIVGGSTAEGEGGFVSVQPLGGGYTGGQGVYSDGTGNGAGAGVIVGPDGPVAGGVTIFGTF